MQEMQTAVVGMMSIDKSFVLCWARDKGEAKTESRAWKGWRWKGIGQGGWKRGKVDDAD